jgi:hypothetical protein
MTISIDVVDLIAIYAGCTVVVYVLMDACEDWFK